MKRHKNYSAVLCCASFCSWFNCFLSFFLMWPADLFQCFYFNHYSFLLFPSDRNLFLSIQILKVSVVVVNLSWQQPVVELLSHEIARTAVVVDPHVWNRPFTIYLIDIQVQLKDFYNSACEKTREIRAFGAHTKGYRVLTWSQYTEFSEADANKAYFNNLYHHLLFLFLMYNSFIMKIVVCSLIKKIK